jgi:ribosomal protein L22
MKIQPIFESNLAEDFKSTWETFHPKGATVTLSMPIETKKFDKFLMIIPDPVILNLDLAEKMIYEASVLEKQISSSKEKTVFSHLNNSKDATAENSIKNDPNAEIYRKYDELDLYNYLQASMSVIISSITAVETFVNILIPADYVHTKRHFFFFKKAYPKAKIERYFTLFDKIELLCNLRNKSDIKQQNFWQFFKKAKGLRDEVVHLKSSKLNLSLVTVYNPIFVELFNLDLQRTFNSIKEMIDFLSPGYIRKP